MVFSATSSPQTRGRKKQGFVYKRWRKCHEGKMTRSCCVLNCTKIIGNGIRMFSIPEEALICQELKAVNGFTKKGGLGSRWSTRRRVLLCTFHFC